MTIPFWTGQQLQSPFAFDTETTIVDLTTTIPQLVLATACDGNQAVVICSEQLNPFVMLHGGHHWVAHNAAFDYWVLRESLILQACDKAIDEWARLVDQGKLHDTMLLDLLVRIARGVGESGTEESKLYSRDLGKLAQAYSTYTIPDKTSTYRLRYHELLGVSDWETVDPGFFEYALNDVRATLEIYHKLVQDANELKAKAPSGLVYSDAEQKYGLLTERLQVLGSISLNQITRNGIAVNLECLKEHKDELRNSVEQALQWLLAMTPQLFERYKKPPQNLKLQPKSGLPKMGTKKLKQVLATVARDLAIEPPKAKGKTGGITTSTGVWEPYIHRSEFLQNWYTVLTSKSTLALFASLESCGQRVHSEYDVVKSTGRVSCRKPRKSKIGVNLQQMPKGSGFRDAFVPSPGYIFYICDYAAIELRTLASICLTRFGKSVLADIFQRPAPFNDPHSYTASLMLKVPFEEFLSWKRKNKASLNPDSDEYKQAVLFDKKRQASKACNFGLPGGLGAVKLVDYARSNYGVILTQNEAEEFRERIINDVYPEMGLYLKDNTPAILAQNLGLPEPTVRQVIRDICKNVDAFGVSVSKVLKDQAVKADGTPYRPNWVRSCWQVLDVLARQSPLITDTMSSAIHERQVGYDLHDLLLGQPAVVPTGRLRGGVRFTQLKNTPFQGLAADGAKLAMWRLIQQGFRIAAFVHDELIVELPLDQADSQSVLVKQIMEESMFEVLNGLVPVEAEGKLCTRWSK